MLASTRDSTSNPQLVLEMDAAAAAAAAATGAAPHTAPRSASAPDLNSGLPASEHHSLYNAHLHQLQQLQADGTNRPAQSTIPVSAPNNPYAPTSAPDIQGQPFAAAAVVGQHPQHPQPDYSNSAPQQGSTLAPQQYAPDATARQSGDLFLMQHPDQNQSQFPFHALQQNQKHLNRSQALQPHSKSPIYHTQPNQLFSHQQAVTAAAYPQIHQQTTDRIPNIPHSQAPQQQPRSLLHHNAPYLPQNDSVNRYAHQQMPQQHPPSGYMLQQHAQQLTGVPDDFAAQGHHIRSHDPRNAAGMVGFPPNVQQFDMQRYPVASQANIPALANFSVPGANPSDSQPADNSALLAGQNSSGAIYKPLVPRTSAPALQQQQQQQQPQPPPPPQQQQQQAVYPKAAPALGVSRRPSEATIASNAVRKSGKDKPVPTIKKAPRLAMGSVASSALTAAAASQSEAVPSTVVSDAVGGSTADIDGSLIERLRGFSHVNQQQPKQQPMLLPQGANLPPNLFPSALEQPGIAPAPTLNHDPYRVPTIRRGQVAGARDPNTMLPGQAGMTLGAGAQVPINLRGSSAQGGATVAEATPERPFKCKYCQASFGRRDNMQKHERSIHMGERPFVCEICSYAFQKKDHKDKHVRTVHLKERPYQCTLCESRFGQKSDLTKHIRTVHQRIKPFRCEHCGLSFGHRGNKLRHVFVVHQKRKPHVCRICNQAFGERSNLAKHSLAVHKLALK